MVSKHGHCHITNWLVLLAKEHLQNLKRGALGFRFFGLAIFLGRFSDFSVCFPFSGIWFSVSGKSTSGFSELVPDVIFDFSYLVPGFAWGIMDHYARPLQQCERVQP